MAVPTSTPISTPSADAAQQPAAPPTGGAAAPGGPLPVPRKLRGVLTIKAMDDMEFRADRHTGATSQKEIASDRTAKLYRTVGEKKNSLVLHAVAPSDCTDPRAYFTDCVERMTEGMETKKKPKLRGVRLMDDEDLTVTYQKCTRTIEATLRIELEKTPAYNNRLINLMQRISQCFVINQTTFRKQ